MFTALVVDDDEQMLVKLKERINDLGHECDTAGSVYEAEALLDNNDYDYFVFDVELPFRFGDAPSETTGYQFLNSVHGRFKNVPILAISGKEDKYEGLPSKSNYFGSTIFISKSAQKKDSITLEMAIQKYVVDPAMTTGLAETQTPSASIQWLTCEDNGKTVKWQSFAKDGNPRVYVLRTKAVRNAILCLILHHLRDGNFVTYDELKKAGGWMDDVFFTEKHCASKGPIRSHVRALRDVLGLVITYTDFGIEVTQPEK